MPLICTHVVESGKIRAHPVRRNSSFCGPGLFVIIPIIDSVTAVIDERIQTTAFSAESALTKDTVPVNVDAVIFWDVHNAQRAALNTTNYREAIDRVAQTSLREMIGASMTGDAALRAPGRRRNHLRSEIARKPVDWGISVNSVEIRDVAIPEVLQDAIVTPSPGRARENRPASSSVRPRPRSPANLSKPR